MFYVILLKCNQKAEVKIEQLLAGQGLAKKE